MGSLQNKFDWLIDRKIELINFIKNKTTNYNTTKGYISIGYDTGTPYSNITFPSIITHLNTFFSRGFVEVVYCSMFTESGAVASGYFSEYFDRGVRVSVSKVSKGLFNVTVTLPTELAYPNASTILYTYGGHRGYSFNDNIYSTASLTSSSTANPQVWRLITGDKQDYYDGYFTIVIFALFL